MEEGIKTLNTVANKLSVVKPAVKMHFVKCNNSRCNSIFLVDPNLEAGDLGYLCPVCRGKLKTSHAIQCASCQVVINFVYASSSEEKQVFYVEKCSHCIGTVEDEWEIEPIYSPDSYI